jgi:hypothetical protein
MFGLALSLLVKLASTAASATSLRLDCWSPTFLAPSFRLGRRPLSPLRLLLGPVLFLVAAAIGAAT